MAEPTSSLDYNDIEQHVGRVFFGDRTLLNLSAASQVDIEDAVQSGLKQFYLAHDWSFLEVESTLTTWQDIALKVEVDATVTVTGGTYNSPITIVTATSAVFTSGMVGDSIFITGIGIFNIVSFTSTTVVVVLGDASTASADTFSVATLVLSGAAFTTPITVMTASAAAFFPSMIGESIVITGIGTFVIAEYTSSTVINVTGDASTASSAHFSISIANAGNYRLPDDFGGASGLWEFVPNDGWRPVRKVSENWIRKQRMFTSNVTGRPRFVATRAKSTDLESGQRWEAIFHPIPDGEFGLTYTKLVNHDALTDTKKFLAGGTPYAMVARQQCAAYFEEVYNDESGGVHAQKAAKMLQEAIARDQRVSAPEFLGQNLDRSINIGRFRGIERGDDPSSVTIGGVVP